MKTNKFVMFALIAVLALGGTAFAQQQAQPVAPAAPAPAGFTVTVTPTGVTANAPAQVANQAVQQAVQQAAEIAAPVKSVAQKANEWAEVGENIGGAISTGLKSLAHDSKDMVFGKDVSVVDGIEKVSKTDAGRFTMLVIAWKVMGKDAMEIAHSMIGVIIGVPLVVILLLLATWITRRFFMVRTVVTSITGPFWAKDRKKEFKLINADLDDESRYGGLALTWIATVFVGFLIVAFVIL